MKYRIHEVETHVTYDDVYPNICEGVHQISKYILGDQAGRDITTYQLIDENGIIVYEAENDIYKKELLTGVNLNIDYFVKGIKQILCNQDFDFLFLPGINLSESIIIRSSFINTDLSGAHFIKSELIGADFSYAKLWDANLSGANLKGSCLIESNLMHTTFIHAELIGASLKDADLRGADLRGANLEGANLRQAELSGADLRGANLTGADLRGAVLKGTNFTGTVIRGVDFRDTYIKGRRPIGLDGIV